LRRRVGFVTHPDCSLHNWPAHAENARRTDAIERHFEAIGLAEKLIATFAREATKDELMLNHDSQYIKQLARLIPRGIQMLDGDTYINEHSWRAALLSYGGSILAVEKVLTGEWERAFCSLRPPGHHAMFDHAMGFCLFNNVAGAARAAQSRYGIERVAIVDFDVHHGNGTQWSFYEDNTVHYTSIHQYPFYPGTGASYETGAGIAEGYTLNLPLSPGSDGKTALILFEPAFRSAMDMFRPNLVLISAGFDAHKDDPLASLRFEDEDYRSITNIICDVADRYCDGRIVSVLEGGYDYDALARSAAEHVKGLLDVD
jgi:acetoin utilization deacetylase AcuC-like enzyme